MTKQGLGDAMTVSEFVDWDDEVIGLGRRYRLASAPRWIVQTRVDGKSRKRVLGDANAISIVDARIAARRVLDRIAKSAPMEMPDAPDPMATLSDFAPRWMRDKAGSWKAATARGHKKQLENQILPTLGAMRLRDLRRKDVERWRRDLDCASGTINRAMAVLSGMMRHAELLGIIPAGSNPCKGLRKKDTSFKARYLTEKEYRRLGKALEALHSESPDAIDLIRFLAVTGCRRSEARLLRWRWIEGGAARLPDSKSGPISIWLGKAAIRILDERPRRTGLVFSVNGKPLSDQVINLAWRKATKAARLGKIRVHDLRHSFASTAVRSGESLRTVAGLLSHADVETTEGYAHLGATDVRDAAVRVGAMISGKIDQPSGLSALSAKRSDIKDAKAIRAKARIDRERVARAEASPELRAFFRSGRCISRFCEAKGLDPEVLGAEVRAYRRAKARMAAKPSGSTQSAEV
ncbi:MAG: tyrosine-type recombinase/integrase [Pseudomonadota bacterium]